MKDTKVSVSVFTEKTVLMADKMSFGEGASINRPPLFCGVNYQFCKVRMKIFMHSTVRVFGKRCKMVPLYLKSKEIWF